MARTALKVDYLLAPTPIRDRRTLEQAAYEQMRRIVLYGGVKPGDRLSVNSLAQQMGVSRLPVIHALRRLASEGLVQIQPHRNVIVTKHEPKELRCHCLMLAALEEVALREGWPLAPKEIKELQKFHLLFRAKIKAGEPAVEEDHAFHEVIWRAPQSQQIVKVIENVWLFGAYYRYLGQRKMPHTMKLRIAEHAAIVDSIVKGDLEAAVRHLHTHRYQSWERVKALIEAENHSDR